MASTGCIRGLIACVVFISLIFNVSYAIDIFLNWNVALDYTINPLSQNQPVRVFNASLFCQSLLHLFCTFT